MRFLIELDPHEQKDPNADDHEEKVGHNENIGQWWLVTRAEVQAWEEVTAKAIIILMLSNILIFISRIQIVPDNQIRVAQCIK